MDPCGTVVMIYMNMQQAMEEAQGHIAQRAPQMREEVRLVPLDVVGDGADGDSAAEDAGALVELGKAQEGTALQIPVPSYALLCRVIPETEEWLCQNIPRDHVDMLQAYVKLNACGLLLLANAEAIYQVAIRHGEKFTAPPVVSSRRAHFRYRMLALGRLLHRDIGCTWSTSRQTLAWGRDTLQKLLRYKVFAQEPSVDTRFRLRRLARRVSDRQGSAADHEMIEMTVGYLEGAQAAFETLIPADGRQGMREDLLQAAAGGVVRAAASQAGHVGLDVMFGGILRIG